MEEKGLENSNEINYLHGLYAFTPSWEKQLLELHIARMSHAY